MVAAENVRAKRARLRLTQRQAAAKAGVQPSIWSTIETGQRRLTLDDCWRVCEALGMTLPELLDGAPQEARRALGV
jgi:transcriptional regulator with XRE-family HTH domain